MRAYKTYRSGPGFFCGLHYGVDSGFARGGIGHVFNGNAAFCGCALE